METDRGGVKRIPNINHVGRFLLPLVRGFAFAVAINDGVFRCRSEDRSGSLFYIQIVPSPYFVEDY